MIAAPDDQAEEAERRDWLISLDSFETNMLLGYLAAAAPGPFDQARAFVERIRAGRTT